MPRPRRILSLWFPRLAAERVLRQERGTINAPFAIVSNKNNAPCLASLSVMAEVEGLSIGQPLRDARAFCPTLLTRPANPQAEAAFLARLRRWAGKFTPFIAEEPDASLLLDITGCAHLFQGEVGLLKAIHADCAALNLSVESGIADTPGAAWALARFLNQKAKPYLNGDAIAQEARATRSRAVRRNKTNHWAHKAAASYPVSATPVLAAISAPGQTRQSIAALPVAALRLPPATTAGLLRLGVRRVADLTGLPRATLARRFGRDVLKRLDQALGAEPEPITPVQAQTTFAMRLTLPEPIGLDQDIMAAINRLLPRLCDKLCRHGKGARRIRLELFRADHSHQQIEAGLARPSHDPDQIYPLIIQKLADVDPGFGIDVIRLEASQTEPLHPKQHVGHAEAQANATARAGNNTTMTDLLTRLGGRIGLRSITRLHPADSHIPEKTATVMGAAWVEPATDWPRPATPRPLVMFAPDIVTPGETQTETRSHHHLPPKTFRWRRRLFTTATATGPERITPEWWLDDPDWRSGVRDYWQLETASGIRLWLFYAHGGLVSGGWFCHGVFA